MNFITEHSGVITLFVTTAIMIVGWAMTLQKVKDKLDFAAADLRQRADDNKAAIQRSAMDMKEAFLTDIREMRVDHDRTRDILSNHIMCGDVHQSHEEKMFRSEWRKSVMDRLERIESGIMDLKRQNGH